MVPANISVKPRNLINLATHSFHSYKSSCKSVDEFPPFDTLNRGGFSLEIRPLSAIVENMRHETLAPSRSSPASLSYSFLGTYGDVIHSVGHTRLKRR